MKARRIVVIGGSNEGRAGVVRTLRSAGLDEVESATSLDVDSPVDAPALIVAIGPDVALLCAEAREMPPLADVALLALVPSIPADAGAAALSKGADDVLVEPASAALLGARVRALLGRAELAGRLRHLELLERAGARIRGLIGQGNDEPDVLREALEVAANAMGFDRASLIAHIEGSDHAYVIAASDDPSLSKFTVAVSDYPEVGAALASREPVLVGDVQRSPITSDVASTLAEKAIGSIAIFPVMWKKRMLGVLRFRTRRSGLDGLDEHRMSFGRGVASQAAVLLRHGKVIESLREQTHRISRARYEAERRLRTIDSLKEHFEAAADGVVALDEEGRILFVNRTAEAITGFARDGLIGSGMLDLVPPPHRHTLQEVIRSVLEGHNIEAFDLDLSTTSGEPICVSVTTSTVLSRSGAVILSFRDVTAQRVLETELRKTKEFLEKLIDSTVDAIVAADVRGEVVLFNQGAERIYGYAAEEVLGRIPVWELYPEGVASQVMRMLRSTSYGGVGRLEQTRREVLSRNGELVPVNMTASVIYEDGREVATVGIFSDLRERIRIEQRLLQAQEQLEYTEKQRVIAELAGAAAHELNQPLTSIIGYSELIKRQSEEDARHVRAVDTILQEAERMADIVKKIGRITKFETKEYVGGAAILDLDKSAPHSSSPDLVIPDDLFADDND